MVRRAKSEQTHEQEGRSKGPRSEETSAAQLRAERGVGESVSMLACPLVDRPANAALRARVVARLQRERGNQFAQRLLQAKLTVGAPDDQYEREADRVAHEISRTPEHRIQPQEEEEEWLEAKRRPGTGEPDIQRQVEGEEEEEEEMMQPKAARGVPAVQAQEIPEEEEWLQMKARPGAQEPDIQLQAEEEEGKLMMRPEAGPAIPPVQTQETPEEEEPVQMQRRQEGRRELDPDLEERIDRVRRGGDPLDDSTRSFFETALGQSFDRVRTHTDAASVETAEALGARAFTVGQNIVFGAGEYAPETRAGKELLAHELTHVVQQSGGSLEDAPRTQEPGTMGEGHAAQRQKDEEGEDLQALPVAGSPELQELIVQRWADDQLVQMPWFGADILFDPSAFNGYLRRLGSTTREVTEDLVPSLADKWDYLQAVIPMHRERLTSLAVPEQERMRRAFASGGGGALRQRMADFQVKEAAVQQKIANNLGKASQYEGKIHSLNARIADLQVVRGEVEAERTQADMEGIQREWARVQQAYDDAVGVVSSLAALGVAGATGGGAAAGGAAPGAFSGIATLVGREVIRDRYHPRVEALRGQLRELRALIGTHRSTSASEQILAAAAEVRTARAEVDASTQEVRGAMAEYQHAFRELAFSFQERGIQTPMAMLEAENEMVFQAEGLVTDIRRFRRIQETAPVSDIDRAIDRLRVVRMAGMREANLDIELRCDHNIEVLRRLQVYYNRVWELWGDRLEWLRGREYLQMVREARDRMAGALQGAASVQR